MKPEDADYRIVRFDPDRHDRNRFDCGIPAVNNYFRKTANKLAKADNIRLFVMEDANCEVIGFYALNAHAVSYTDLPARYARARPAHGEIPAGFISMIGRDLRYRNRSFGADLLVDALERLARTSDDLGLSVVMLDVLDCGDADRTRRRAALYADYGFQPLVSRPLRMFLPVATVKKVLSSLNSGDRG